MIHDATYSWNEKRWHDGFGRPVIEVRYEWVCSCGTASKDRRPGGYVNKRKAQVGHSLHAKRYKRGA